MIIDFLSRFFANMWFVLVMAYAGVHWFELPWTRKRFIAYIVVSTSLHSFIDMMYYMLRPSAGDAFMFMAVRSGLNHVLGVVLLQKFIGIQLWEAILCMAVSIIGLPFVETAIIYMDMRFYGFHNLLENFAIWPTIVTAMFNFLVIHVSGLAYKALKNPRHSLSAIWSRITAVATTILLACLVLNEVHLLDVITNNYSLFPSDHFVVALLMLISIGLISLFLSVQSEVMKDYNRTYLQFHKVIEQQYQATREARENYQERLDALRLMSEQGEYDEIGFALGSMRDVRAEIFDDEYMHAVALISDAGLRNILLVKLLWAKTQKVQARLRFSSDIVFHPMQATDFHDILAILLDNAIEAASDAKTRHIDVRWDCSDDENVLTLQNTCVGSPPVAKIFAPGYTTKQDHSGIGLTHFRRIMQRYEGVFYEADSGDGVFAIKLFFSKDALIDE